MTLALLGRVRLPAHAAGEFDHGDVHLPTGRVFVAHTANGTVEVIDGERLALERTLPGCSEGSGILCTGDETNLVFAAARGESSVLVIDPLTCAELRRVPVGPGANGLAWDSDRSALLVADVTQNNARLVDPRTGAGLALAELPGRPRWCVYDAPRHRFLVNVREPACVVALAADTLQEIARIEALPAGPHGLDLDRQRNRAFVACDASIVVVLDLATDEVLGRVSIAGEPDAIWYSSAIDRLYVAIGRPGVVDVIDGRTFAVVEKVSTEEGAHTTAFDSRRGRLYVFLPKRCEAAVYQEAASAPQG